MGKNGTLATHHSALVENAPSLLVRLRIGYYLKKQPLFERAYASNLPYFARMRNEVDILEHLVVGAILVEIVFAGIHVFKMNCLKFTLSLGLPTFQASSYIPSG